MLPSAKHPLPATSLTLSRFCAPPIRPLPVFLTAVCFLARVLDVSRELGEDVAAHVEGLLVLGAQVRVPSERAVINHRCRLQNHPKSTGKPGTASPAPPPAPSPAPLPFLPLFSVPVPRPGPALLPRFPHPPSPRRVCNYVGGPRVCSRNSSILMKSVFSSLLNSRKGGLVPGAKSFSSSGFLEQRK